MKNLKFNRLALLSDSTKSANLFEFQSGRNLITGTANSIGKSSLVKSLFWAMGCAPIVDSAWTALDCKALVEISVGTDSYKIYRYHDTIKVNKNNTGYKTYQKITGDFAEDFSKIVSFQALLPKRVKEGEVPDLETPAPAYYFLPFYVDQLRSWDKSWEAFDKLHQYERWQRTIIEYHTGYLVPEHFELESQIYEYRKKKEYADNEVKRIDTALDVVGQYIPSTNFTIDEKELEEMTKEVREKLNKLSQEQEVSLDKISSSSAEVYHLRQQLNLLTSAISKTEEDYRFATENIDGDDIECPICGTHHSNTIVDKAEILADKDQIERQAKSTSLALKKAEKILDESNKSLDSVRKEIEAINAKYALDDENGKRHSLPNIVESIAAKAVQRNVNETKNAKQAESKTAQDKQKELKKQQSLLLTKEQKEERDKFFLETLSQYLEFLKATDINLSKVKKPTDHNKIIGGGDAAKIPRVILAYQMTVIDMAQRYGSSSLAPLVVDTPNQQEQDDANYQSMIKFITEKTHKEQQVFLCALENEALTDFKKSANIIQLNTKDRLLTNDKYDEVRKMLEVAIKAN